MDKEWKLMEKFIGGDKIKLDNTGRIILPSHFKKTLLKYYGPEIYITSINEENALIFPIKIWQKYLKPIENLSPFDPLRINFFRSVNLFGQVSTMDSRGRILIPPQIRQKANLKEWVAIISQHEYLEIWDYEYFEKNIIPKKMDDKQLSELANKSMQRT